ncbi:hypothetical protein [Phytomonospora endophytica]|uniref:Uncharacterized protein n=1 Tax=Phytomonospora endophytica TaxID=714109 RepID=A0A841G224_9ACTN|nr:hypothetical protein [Phytomonospora endophytica]MBB6039968.1 hypothetical protein [Phytomonospora endophytica]GIG69826.1 hypothetical protein Pen01_61210 [Phytomonospora endophytica]
MAIRHRRPPRLGRKTRRTLIGCALLALLVPLTAVALRVVIDRAQDCAETLDLEVAAAPAIASALRDVAGSLPPGSLRVNATCVSVTITEADSAAVAAALVEARGGRIDVGDGSGNGPAAVLPHVWVPESRAWSLRVDGAVDAGSGTVLGAHQPSVAFSPVGLAARGADAEKYRPSLDLDDWDPAKLPVCVGDPRRDVAALAALAAFDNVGAGRKVEIDTELAADELPKGFKAVPMSRLDLDAHNAEHPDEPWVLLETRPAVTGLDFPYAMRADLSGLLSQAAEKFLAVLDDEANLARLTAVGLLPPDQYQPVLTTAAVTAALNGVEGSGT